MSETVPPAETESAAPLPDEPSGAPGPQDEAPAAPPTGEPAPASGEHPAPATEGEPSPPSQADHTPPPAPRPPDRPKPARPPKGQPPREPKKPRRTAVVRYGLMGNIGEFRHNLAPPPPRDSKVVVRTERGVELGTVVAPVCEEACPGCLTPQRLKQFLSSNGPEYPFRRDGKVLRAANHQDVIDYRHLSSSAREAAAFCRQQIAELKLDMKLVTVEHLLGGERIVFYFAAEQRVDFRELVRRLAGQYRTRIEMRQVGARDEARLVGDYERCGQQCCCQRYLKDLKPVAMRMAKTQKATLDPSKISGRCGRLMCCLRYEDASYEELRKLLPRRNTWVRTDNAIGRVVETQTLTQLVRLQLTDNSRIVVANEEIVERDAAPPPKPEPALERSRRESPRGRPAAAERRPPARPEPRDKQRTREAPVGEAAPKPAATGRTPEQTAEGEAPTKKRRRRRRSRRSKGGEAAATAKPAASSQSDSRAQPPSPDGPTAASGGASAPPAEAPPEGKGGDGGKPAHKPRRRRRSKGKRRRRK